MCESKSWALADLRELPHTTYVVPEIHHAPANHKANRSTLRSWSGGAVRINQITCIRSELLQPAKALPPDSLQSPISCSPKPQHGKSTSTLHSICQTVSTGLIRSQEFFRYRLASLDIRCNAILGFLRQDSNPCIVIMELSMAISCVDMCSNRYKGGHSQRSGIACSKQNL